MFQPSKHPSLSIDPAAVQQEFAIVNGELYRREPILEPSGSLRRIMVQGHRVQAARVLLCVRDGKLPRVALRLKNPDSPGTIDNLERVTRSPA